MSYIGNPIVSTDFPVDYASGNGSTTAFTLSVAPASVNSIDVQISGVSQSPQTYSVSGTTLTFSTAPPSGTNNIVVRHLGVAGIPNTPSAGSVVTTSIADGVITAAKFASGQTPSFNGITFPATQSASADANTLDDYEEGTWTPTLNITSGSVTYSNQSGTYTKIGGMVNVNFYIVVNTSSSGVMTNDIQNLPFVAARTTYAGASFAYNGAGLFNGYATIQGLIGNTSTAIQLRGSNNAAVAPSLVFSGASVSNGTAIAGSLTYFAA